MFIEEDPVATIKITFDDASPEWKTLIYTLQALSISMTLYIGISASNMSYKLYKSFMNRHDYNGI